MTDRPTDDPPEQSETGPADSVHRGVRLMALMTLFARGAAFLTSIVVGYYVSEAEFGVVSLAIAVLMILAAMRESGLGQALVRDRGLDEHGERRAADTIFWILLGSNAFLAAFVIMAAPWITGLVSDSEDLTGMLRVVAGFLVLDTFLAVPRFLLLRRMHFSRLAPARSLAALVQTFVTIGMAMLGLGAWSLVIGQGAQRLAFASLLIRASGWTPGFVFDRSLAGRLFSFGKWLWALTLVQAIGNRLDRFFLGHEFGDASVGVYAMALQLCRVPVVQMANVVQSVALPAFARMESLDEQRQAFLRGSTMLVAVAVPAALGLGAVAPAFVETVLAERWRGTVPIMQVLCLHALLLATATSTGPVLNAMGKSRAVFAVGLVEQGVLLLCLALFVGEGGPLAAAWSLVGALSWSVLSSYYTTFRALSIDPRPWISRVVRIVICGIAMNRLVDGVDGAVWAQAGTAAPGFVRLGALVMLGALSYALGLLALERATFHQLRKFGLKVAGR